MPQRITAQFLALLITILTDSEREWYGLELMEETGLSSGTLYPLLHRLVDDGWLARTRDAPSELGGTGRRLYKLVGTREAAAREIVASRARPAAERRRALKPRAGLV